LISRSVVDLHPFILGGQNRQGVSLMRKDRHQQIDEIIRRRMNPVVNEKQFGNKFVISINNPKEKLIIYFSLR